MTETSKLLAVLMRELSAEPSARDYSTPQGWSSVDDIRKELGLAHTRNASSRAYELHKRGLLDRQPHQFKCGTGQCHMAYVYRPRKPYKSILEATRNAFIHQADKVPKGFVRIIDYAVTVGVSNVAVQGRAIRAGIKPTYFKTPRGISGLHLNAYYRKADLDRLYKA
jgi:hypothetical protein